MIRNHRPARVIASALLATLALGTLAPAAQASHRRAGWAPPAPIRYKDDGRGFAHHHSTYVVRRSDSGAAIGGFLGGLFLGAVLASSAPDGYAYYDSYCDRRFVSLNAYYSHSRHHHHPRVIRVVQVVGHPGYRHWDGWDGYGDGGDDWDD